MSRRTKSRTALIVAALQLTLSVGLGLNLVVCRSVGGHVAVESVLADCCTNGSPSEASWRPSSGSDCDGCVDTPLLQTVFQREAAPNRALQAPPQLLSVSASVPTPPLAPSSVAVRDAHGAATTIALSSRRFVVLLV